MVGLLSLLVFAGIGVFLLIALGTVAEMVGELFRAVRHTRRALLRVVVRGTRRSRAPDNRQS